MKVLFVTISLCGFLYCFARPGELTPLPPPVTESTIKLTGIDGQKYDLAQMRGNVVLVSFGATWCIPCSQELRALEDLKREYKDRPVRFFWVDIERTDTVSDKELQKFARERKLTFPVLRDPTQMTFAQFSRRIRLPMIVFYDKEGRLDNPVHFGMSSAEVYKNRMRERLNKLL
ncbi:MAG TPA: TlpA disulfide reductase family protein [Pyrinomonadaceae bacterium]|jgi:peroxiredoxin